MSAMVELFGLLLNLFLRQIDLLFREKGWHKLLPQPFQYSSAEEWEPWGGAAFSAAKVLIQVHSLTT